MHSAIYERLHQTARSNDLVSYGEIAPLAGVDLEDPMERNRLAMILDEISRHEYNVSRPMLKIGFAVQRLYNVVSSA